MKKSLIAAMVLAGASLGSTAVMAQDDISSAPQALDWTDFSADFGDTFGAGNAGDTFADRFTFTVEGTVGSNLDAIVSSISRTAGTGLAITGLALYGANNVLVSAGSALDSGIRDVWTVAGNNLSAGDYYLQVSGSLVSDSAASFGGSVALAPVPEPATYGMLLAGLGMVGWMARRRARARRD